MSNSWPSVHVNQQPVTRKCHCHTLIHTSMRSPWQQVSSQHMGVYCFGSCTSPSCLCVLHSMWRCVCVSHSACPHVILEYINYTSLSVSSLTLTLGCELSSSSEYRRVKNKKKAEFPPQNEGANSGQTRIKRRT